MKLPISLIIITYNEEVNIRNCLESVKDLVSEIIIVDSYSTDRTLEIAREYTQRIFQHSFVSWAKQVAWALNSLTFNYPWLMRLDADEFIPDKLAQEMKDKLLSLPESVTNVFLKRKTNFLVKEINFGDRYPVSLLRLWRSGSVYCEGRFMDEHIISLEGKSVKFKNYFVDYNQKPLHFWIDKHNDYATKEALDILDIKYHIDQSNILTKTNPWDRNWLKIEIYLKLPMFLRAFLYFIYRYIFCFGFLDGWSGLLWNVLQGFWYRFLVDAKIFEIKKNAKKKNISIKESVKQLYGKDIQ